MLWKKVAQGLSAGRVQSVATRLVVERERERMRFVAAGYWDLDGEFAMRRRSRDRFTATLVQLDGARVATGKDFDLEGRPTRDDVVVLDEAGATALAAELTGAVVRGSLGRAQALPPPAGGAVHHVDLPAGGRAQAAPVGAAGHALRPVALRERLHHLHADRQHHAVEHRAQRRP